MTASVKTPPTEGAPPEDAAPGEGGAPAAPAGANAGAVRALLAAPEPDLAEIAARVDALDLGGKLEEMLTLGRRAQARLWDLAAKNPALAVGDLLGDSGEPAQKGDDAPTWIWEGVNSLPFFRRFQKRVVRQDEETLAGYNEQALRWLTGPGCFTVRRARPEEAGSLVFDYIRTPSQAAVGCPKVVPASRGLSRFVYGGMLDHMHRVSRDVVIGRAWRNGRVSDNYFLLARGPRA